MAVVSLSLVMIRSPEIDRAALFYGLLGLNLEKHRHGNGPLHYAAQIGSTVFEIYPRKDGTDSTASIRLGFRVASLDSAVEALQTAGGRIVSTPRDSEWGRRAVVDDPDGHRIELVEAVEG